MNAIKIFNLRLRLVNVWGALLSGLLLFSSLLLLSCSDSARNVSGELLPLGVVSLQQQENCDGLREYISSSILERNTTIHRYHYLYCGDPREAQPSPIPGGGSGAPAAGDTATAPDGVSDTNNQEVGVNEGDIVKADSDGTVYLISGRHFIVAKGFPPSELSILKEVDLGMHATQMFLDKTNHRVVVVGREDQPYYIMPPVTNTDPIITNPIANDETAAIFFNIATPADPQVVDRITFSGYYHTGRRIDNRLHMVLRDYYNPDELYLDTEFWTLRQAYWNRVREIRCDDPDASIEDIEADPDLIAAKQGLASKITTVVNAMSDDVLVPTAKRTNNAGEQRLPYLACSDIYHPGVSANLGLQILASMDTDAANLDATAVINSAWQIYSSQNSLYMAETSRNWWWRPFRSEDEMKSQTAIYKFRISQGKPEYVATGVVPGQTRNQFSFSEHNNVLRVATTEDNWIAPTSTGEQWQRVLHNSVFTLENNAGTMSILGEVRGFGKDESIQSSRFIGNRGYVVTFRNVDPLFTFDLSDPSNPRLMGELTIPGFSRYLHPYDENHLITIGRGQNGNALNALQLQIFDVTDLTDPQLLHAYMPEAPSGWSWSAAEHDHKAFTFYKPRNLLAIPLQFTPTITNAVFNGIVAYDVSLEDGFTELGRVDHSDLARDYYCNPNSGLLPAHVDSCENGWYVRWAAPRRSVVMTSGADTYLYSISDVGVKASDVADLSTALASILFPPQPYPYWYFGWDLAGIVPSVPADGPMAAQM